MKKKIIAALLTLSLFLLQSYYANSAVFAQNNAKEIKIIVAFNPENLKTSPHILAAYESVLQEEGVPYTLVDINKLIAINAGELQKTSPVILLPDAILQNIPEKTAEWLKQYLTLGGNVAVVFDVGVKTDSGLYLDRSPLADITGINYITYGKTGASAYDTGNVQFTSDKSRDHFQIPAGKTMDLTLSSYNYGKLNYPIAKNEIVGNIPASSIYAYGINNNKESFPLLVLTDYAKGKVLYVNLPLGYLKGSSDDLPLRSFLRTFLFDTVGIPHVMNVEQGRGGIVINWHVDADIEHTSSPWLLKHGYFRKDIPCSIHVTAGDFFLTPGDDTGFDAAGRGKRIVLLLKDYGLIGSHGGWAHNWFSDNVNNGTFKDKEIYEQIKRNNECLEKIVGYKITEYAAPNGVHPQPAATKALEELGVIAYYYVGDSGSFPNRVFADGKMVSDKVIAFPIMPFEKTGSIWEARALAKKSDREITEWFNSTLNYVTTNKTVRMIYSHPYDVQNYPQAIKAFLDKVAAMRANNELMVRPMSEYAKFFLRYLKTSYAFNTDGKQLIIKLSNPDDLNGITVAVPKKYYQKPSCEGITIHEDEQYFYFIVVGNNEKEKIITVDYK